MANQRNGDYPLTDADREREAPWRAEIQQLQQQQESTQQSIQRLQDRLEQLLGGPNQNHRDDDARDDDGIRVRPVHHRRPAPNNRQPIHDEFSDDEDYAEGVFGRNVGADRRGGGRGGAGRGGAGFRGNVNGDAGYRRAYGEQPMRQDYGREESREYRMKIDLPSFNGHLHIEDFLDWVTEGREILRLHEYSRRTKGEVGGLQVQGRSIRLVGTATSLTCPTR
jgi:hypothetical protein